MDRMPLGVSRLDSTFGGGAPAGSVVLLAGEPGAGAREFCYTSAAMHGVASADAELFDLYYGEPEGAVTMPEEVHYVTFTDEPNAVVDEMRFVADDELVDAATDGITIADLSAEYFHLTPVPTEWYADRTVEIADLGEGRDHDGVLEALGTYLSEHAAGNLVVLDSLTDLLGADDRAGVAELATLTTGLSRAAYRWGGVILVHAAVDSLDRPTLGRLKEAADGTLLFEWESGGSERARTLVVEEFRGVLSRLEDEDVVRFETEIGGSGFDVSNVRKIR